PGDDRPPFAVGGRRRRDGACGRGPVASAAWPRRRDRGVPIGLPVAGGGRFYTATRRNAAVSPAAGRLHVVLVNEEESMKRGLIIAAVALSSVAFMKRPPQPYRVVFDLTSA